MTTENGQKVGLAGTALWHTHRYIYIYIIHTHIYMHTHTERMRTISLSIVVILGTYHRMFTSAYMIINDHISQHEKFGGDSANGGSPNMGFNFGGCDRPLESTQRLNGNSIGFKRENIENNKHLMQVVLAFLL